MAEGTLRPEAAESLRHLAARWAHADKHLLRNVFPLLFQGSPVSVAAIADVTGALETDVAEALRAAWAGFDPHGRVVELSGLMLTPSPHRVVTGGVACFSCCALMAHLASLLIGEAADVESVDPVSRGVIRLRIQPDGVTGIDPPAAVGSFVTTDPAAVMDDVTGNFCSHVRHFASPDTAAGFLSEDGRRYEMSVAELHEAAVRLHRLVWA